MLLAAGPRAASTVTVTAVIPAIGATRPTVVAAPDALGTGDVLEDEEQCKMENYL
jgi:hypothetical protein